ncbi:MAG: nitroreductase family protein [Sarcina sp.]
MDESRAWIDAIDVRKSTRRYKLEVISSEKIKRVQDLIDGMNENEKINIRLVKEGKKVFSKFKSSYGMFEGVRTFIALIADKSLSEYKKKMGYFGEMLVLEAVSSGLGTCWIGGTYDKQYCIDTFGLKETEELVCIIAIGKSNEKVKLRDKFIKAILKNNKSIEEFIISDEENIPAYIKGGIVSASKAPSALNKKPIRYEYKNGKVYARIVKSNNGFEEVDLGISMLHFELGSLDTGYTGKWTFENGENIYT